MSAKRIKPGIPLDEPRDIYAATLLDTKGIVKISSVQRKNPETGHKTVQHCLRVIIRSPKPEPLQWLKQYYGRGSISGNRWEVSSGDARDFLTKVGHLSKTYWEQVALGIRFQDRMEHTRLYMKSQEDYNHYEEMLWRDGIQREISDLNNNKSDDEYHKDTDR